MDQERISADEYDAWTCLCGNQAHLAGFYPCDRDGNQVEPTEKDWLTNWYVCDRCGRVIDNRTLIVVGRQHGRKERR